MKTTDKLTLDVFLNKDGSINIKKVMSLLRLNENSSTYKYLKKKVHFTPSVELSKKLGIDIHTDWNIPSNWTYADFEMLIMALYHVPHLLIELFIKIVDENKIIRNIFTEETVTDLRLQMYDILMGMSTRLNYDDINEYVKGGYYYIKQNDPLWAEKINKIENNHGLIGYVMSYKTLEKIKI